MRRSQSCRVGDKVGEPLSNFQFHPLYETHPFSLSLFYRSVQSEGNECKWSDGNLLTFDGRSSWGGPQTLSLRISEATDEPTAGEKPWLKEVGYSWVDIASMWKKGSSNSASVSCQIWSAESLSKFDDHGDLPGGLEATPEVRPNTNSQPPRTHSFETNFVFDVAP